MSITRKIMFDQTLLWKEKIVYKYIYRKEKEKLMKIVYTQVD